MYREIIEHWVSILNVGVAILNLDNQYNRLTVKFSQSTINILMNI